MITTVDLMKIVDRVLQMNFSCNISVEKETIFANLIIIKTSVDIKFETIINRGSTLGYFTLYNFKEYLQ